jgi:hypothetical protein
MGDKLDVRDWLEDFCLGNILINGYLVLGLAEDARVVHADVGDCVGRRGSLIKNSHWLSGSSRP